MLHQNQRHATPPATSSPSVARRSRSSLPALLRVGLAAVAVAVGAAALPVSATESAEGVDVLQASREEVRQGIAALDARIAQKVKAVELVQVALDRANAAVDVANARVDLARNEVAVARSSVKKYAVEAFVRPPAGDSLAVLSVSKMEEAANATNVLEILASRRKKVVDTLLARQATLEQQSQQATAAKVQAQSRLDQIRADLDSLQALHATQDRVAADLDERLDRALAEAASIRVVNPALADELTKEEVALRRSAPPTPPTTAPAPPSRSAPPTAPTTTEAPGPTVPGETTTTVKRTTTTTTIPPVLQPPVVIPNLPSINDMTRVGGIYVAKSLAGRLQGLLSAATAAGISLGGGGYRSSASQIILRTAHCGPSAYAIYQMPASQCRPPTARPGASMHERGLAVDFTSSGALITSRTSPAFIWLKANAGSYGFYNLPSEPWHWSTNGN
ncbi:MAG: D-alanyl-D-alanine carboxypeptidase family protein [Actinomycetes bacterium]